MKYFVIDAFADEVFKGNPAGVCLPDRELDDFTMQKIAFENNFAETAFLQIKNDKYYLRWFTPETEIDLCGHATLATAFVLMNYLNLRMNKVDFYTKSGVLTVVKQNDFYIMDFPSRKPIPCATPALLENAIGVKILETQLSRDLLVLIEKESDVANLNPDMALLATATPAFAVVVTAKGENCDFVSRFFAPNAGISEDPVTGSSHCTLIPFWSERLHKFDMIAKQLSKRGGTLVCKDKGERVEIGGKAVCYSIGDVLI